MSDRRGRVGRRKIGCSANRRQPRSFRRLHRIDLRRQPRHFAVGLGYGGGERVGFPGFDKGDHAAAKSRSRLACADYARRDHHGLHHRQHRARADLVEVSRSHEGVCAEAADGAAIARSVSAFAIASTRSFSPTMNSQRLRMSPDNVAACVRVASRNAATPSNAAPSSHSARRAPYSPAYEFARRLGVANHDADAFRQMHGKRRKVAAIKQQGAAGAAEARGELIEDAAVHPDVLVLGALAKLARCARRSAPSRRARENITAMAHSSAADELSPLRIGTEL